MHLDLCPLVLTSALQEMAKAFDASDPTLNAQARQVPLDRMQWQADAGAPVTFAVPSKDLLKFDGPRGVAYAEHCHLAFAQAVQLCALFLLCDCVVPLWPTSRAISVRQYADCYTSCGTRHVPCLLQCCFAYVRWHRLSFIICHCPGTIHVS
jgi:hypothetical protein